MNITTFNKKIIHLLTVGKHDHIRETVYDEAPLKDKIINGRKVNTRGAYSS